MADGTLAGLSWSRADASGSLPAHSMRRGGQWLTLARAEVGERVRDAAQALPALGGKRGEAVALSAPSRAERVWALSQTETWTAVPWDRFESLLSTVVVAA